MDGLRILLLVQGGYFLLTGLWPLFHLQSFEAITGPKVDKWLVRTVGALAAAIGVPLLVAFFRGTASSDLALVGVLSAIGFIGIDVVYVARGRIRRIYLADAGLEALFVLGWLAFWPRG